MTSAGRPEVGSNLRTGLSEPTLRYYEQVGLIALIVWVSTGSTGAVSTGSTSGRESDVDALQALACLRAMGVGIEDMRRYQANRVIGRAASGEQRDILLRHAERVELEIATLRVHLEYLQAKASLWDARDRGDASDEAEAQSRVHGILPELEASIRG
jgi:MerR family copper efflux transcriptional regulator